MANPAPAVAWPDVLTAIVAGAAFVLSIVSLAVQYVLWRNSGPRVRVEARIGFLAWATSTQQVLNVEAANRGRASTQVVSLWLEAKNDDKSWWFRALVPGSADLPTTLEASHEKTWMIDWERVMEAAREQKAHTIRAGIALGSGKKHKSGWLDMSSWLRS